MTTAARGAGKRATGTSAAGTPSLSKRATSKPGASQRGASQRGASQRGASQRGAGRPDMRSASSEYLLRLYVAGQTPRSLQAFATLKAICETHLAGRYQIEVVDLLENPALARGDQILALPTVVRQLPPPVKKLIGDFSDTQRVLVGLDLRPMVPGSRR